MAWKRARLPISPLEWVEYGCLTSRTARAPLPPASRSTCASRAGAGSRAAAADAAAARRGADGANPDGAARDASASMVERRPRARPIRCRARARPRPPRRRPDQPEPPVAAPSEALEKAATARAEKGSASQSSTNPGGRPEFRRCCKGYGGGICALNATCEQLIARGMPEADAIAVHFPASEARALAFVRDTRAPPTQLCLAHETDAVPPRRWSLRS